MKIISGLLILVTAFLSFKLLPLHMFNKMVSGPVEKEIKTNDETSNINLAV